MSRTRKPDAERELGVLRVELAELLSRADVVSLHLPATAETTGLIGARELSTMRPEALLVNTSRGSLVDSGALAQALRDGEIGAAGLDVYETRARRADRAARGAPLRAVAPHRLRHHAIAQRDGAPGGRERSRRALGAPSPPIASREEAQP